MSRKYKNIILTNHAEERAKQRSIGLGAIHQTVNYPDIKSKQDSGQIKFQKIIKDRHYQVLASYIKEEKKWIVVSLWVRGEEDKIPIVWHIIVLPFRIIFNILKFLIKLLSNICKNCKKK